MRGSARNVRSRLAKHADVVQHPNPAPVRSEDQIVVVKGEVAHRGRRQVELQRLPVVAVVKRDEHTQLGTGDEQAATFGIFFDRLHVDARRQAAGDLLPRLARVLRAIDVRIVVLEAMTIDRGIRFVRVEMRRFEHRHLAPRVHPGWCYVLPRLPIVGRDVNVAVVGADPEERRADRRRRDRVDDAEALGLNRDVGGGGGIQIRRHARVLARHVLADPRPALAAVSGLEEVLIAEIQRALIGRREDQRQRPRVSCRRRQIHFRRNLFDLAGVDVALLHRAAEHLVGVQRVGRRVAALATCT